MLAISLCTSVCNSHNSHKCIVACRCVCVQTPSLGEWVGRTVRVRYRSLGGGKSGTWIVVLPLHVRVRWGGDRNATAGLMSEHGLFLYNPLTTVARLGHTHRTANPLPPHTSSSPFQHFLCATYLTTELPFHHPLSRRKV